MPTLPPLFLVGPTGVGKSAVAVQLATSLGADIVSVDSMQVYRGMDIGTAKPSATDRAAVQHHLIDVVDLTESFDAARFVSCAQAIQADAERMARPLVFCGGTGFYLKAYFEGLSEAPAADLALRAELEKAPLENLLLELKEKDPDTYQRIDKRNLRRIIRALEVVRLTGKAYSAQQASWRQALKRPEGCTEPIVLGLARERVDLCRRLEARVDTMFASGLVAEVEDLARRGLIENRTASQALGYRQVLAFLAGRQSLDVTIAEVKTKTRQYARRQMTWFRNQAVVHWLNVLPDETPERMADQAREQYGSLTRRSICCG